MKHPRLAAVTTVVLLGSTAVLTYQNWPSSGGSVRVVAHPAVHIEPGANNVAQGADFPATAKPLPAPERTLQPSQQLGWSKSDEFNRLKGGTVDQRYEAYRIVANCIESYTQAEAVNPYLISMGRKALPVGDQAKCGDLKPGDMDESKALLIEAARAGVHHAWLDLRMDLVKGGPVAMRTGRYLDDAEMKALHEEAVVAGLAKADPYVLDYLYAKSKDGSAEEKAQALVYKLASIEVKNKEVPINKHLAMTDPNVVALVNQLPADVVRDATAKARELAKKGMS